MQRKNAAIFLTGRFIALFVLLTFQILLVRVLHTSQYAIYSLIFAFATLMQTAVSLGIPRVIPKYVSQAGWRLSFDTVKGLIGRLLFVRIVGSLLLMLATLIVMSWFKLADTSDHGLIVIGALFIIAGLVQSDADAMAQSLMLQKISRNCTVGEAALRLALVAWQASHGQIHKATDVLLLSLITASLASAVLITSVLRALSGPAESDVHEPLNWRELWAIGLSGYASSMAWFASSPAVVRLIGSRMLALSSFAGFAFAQNLVISFQRYTPGMLIFPFIEPAVMKDFARTGDRSQLESALSLVTKIDLTCIGAAVVGTIVAGKPIVELLTGGKYGAEAYALSWLLVYIVTSSFYKSFEIVAVALGASSALLRTLALSLVWLAAAVLLTGRFGLITLLVCPVGDALSRLGLMHHALRKIGVRHVIDLKMTILVIMMIAIFGFGGAEVASLLAGGKAGAVIAIGVVSALGYLGCLGALRPLRRREADLVLGDAQGRVPTLLRRFARP